MEGVAEWSALREVRLDVDDVELPESASGQLMSLVLGEGTHRRLPLISSGGLMMAVCLLKFVYHVFDVAGDILSRGLVGQADFMFKIVWQGRQCLAAVAREKAPRNG